MYIDPEKSFWRNFELEKIEREKRIVEERVKEQAAQERIRLESAPIWLKSARNRFQTEDEKRMAEDHAKEQSAQELIKLGSPPITDVKGKLLWDIRETEVPRIRDFLQFAGVESDLRTVLSEVWKVADPSEAMIYTEQIPPNPYSLRFIGYKAHLPLPSIGERYTQSEPSGGPCDCTWSCNCYKPGPSVRAGWQSEEGVSKFEIGFEGSGRSGKYVLRDSVDMYSKTYYKSKVFPENDFAPTQFRKDLDIFLEETSFERLNRSLDIPRLTELGHILRKQRLR